MSNASQTPIPTTRPASSPPPKSQNDAETPETFRNTESATERNSRATSKVSEESLESAQVDEKFSDEPRLVSNEKETSSSDSFGKTRMRQETLPALNHGEPGLERATTPKKLDDSYNSPDLPEDVRKHLHENPGFIPENLDKDIKSNYLNSLGFHDDSFGGY